MMKKTAFNDWLKAQQSADDSMDDTLEVSVAPPPLCPPPDLDIKGLEMAFASLIQNIDTLCFSVLRLYQNIFLIDVEIFDKYRESHRTRLLRVQ
jgi:hypothetical protein